MAGVGEKEEGEGRHSALLQLHWHHAQPCLHLLRVRMWYLTTAVAQLLPLQRRTFLEPGKLYTYK